jgi:hypothetical protein
MDQSSFLVLTRTHTRTAIDPEALKMKIFAAPKKNLLRSSGNVNTATDDNEPKRVSDFLLFRCFDDLSLRVMPSVGARRMAFTCLNPMSSRIVNQTSSSSRPQ